MKKYLKTMIILVLTFFIASFFEPTNFMAFGWGVLISFPYLLYKGVEEQQYKEVIQ
ncbi:hypothetical protein KYI11_10945 [Macrococcoides bohemicum]|uniref:Uncharacterized protein n=1 Tax=Macrococcoides bohemicum TaxID=1903056 RepID=A0AAJ4TW53_9STAP|nr:hypothetical protein [Macrococcus bohemicus]QYA42100.1 hypothetical protein KYI11_10945 [Macrococcus bohemicus]